MLVIWILGPLAVYRLIFPHRCAGSSVCSLTATAWIASALSGLLVPGPATTFLWANPSRAGLAGGVTNIRPALAPIWEFGAARQTAGPAAWVGGGWFWLRPLRSRCEEMATSRSNGHSGVNFLTIFFARWNDLDFPRKRSGARTGFNRWSYLSYWFAYRPSLSQKRGADPNSAPPQVLLYRFRLSSRSIWIVWSHGRS